MVVFNFLINKTHYYSMIEPTCDVASYLMRKKVSYVTTLSCVSTYMMTITNKIK